MARALKRKIVGMFFFFLIKVVIIASAVANIRVFILFTLQGFYICDSRSLIALKD
jgi:hypothetical protein